MKPTKRLSATEALTHTWVVSLTRDKSISNSSLSTKNYRENFAEERKMKKVGSRFNLIDDADILATTCSGKEVISPAVDCREAT